MAIMAEWGDKTWEVSPEKVNALKGLGFSFAQVADNNSTTEEKKPTNHRGKELFSLTFTTVLHSGAGVDVEAEIKSWEKLVTKVNYFYLGGELLGDKLQLRKVGVSVDHLDDFGRIRVATLSFEFKEYDAATTSVKVNTSALKVKASTSSKSQKKQNNEAVKNSSNNGIKVGDYVKPTGKYYATTATRTVYKKNARGNNTKQTTTETYTPEIPSWVKDRSYKVGQIKGDKVLLDGINSWVYLSEVTLV